ncbi:hypothetical protein [Streptomyces sp. NPDC005407]|uniref:hypothetical protein n=1 Tax=Streptomyces sp. NPDC005407 TaxID=3155340 RepID=UPI0033A0330D
MPSEDLSADLEEWEEPERQLLRNALAGRDTSLGSGDPSCGESWGPERTIRATVVRRLLTDPEFASQIARLCLTGAKIVGKLDLEAFTLNGTLELTRCHASEVVNLEQATAPAIYLEQCYLAGIKAAQLHTTHSFSLVGTTCSFATLTGAHIGGQLDLKHAVLPGTKGLDKDTLGLSSISVGSHVTLKGITVTGTVHLSGARIDGQLNLRQGTLSHHGDCALKGLKLETQEDAFLDDGFSADGLVDLTGSVIGGSLHFSRATIHHPGKDPALDLARVTVKQNMYCENGFTTQGMVLLAGATINGSLLARGGQFLHPSDTAIDATGLQVRDVVLSTEPSNHENRNGFRAEGTVVLADAVINGTLNCEGGSITRPRPNKESLNAQGAKITRDLLLSEGFNASGLVDLTGAEIGGQAVWTNGSFENAGQVAISARQLTARTSLLLQDNFLAHGKVDLSGATVDGPLTVGGKIYLPEQEALILDSVTTAQDVEFEVGLLVEGSLCMRAADVGSNLKIIKPNLSRGREGLALTLEGTVIAGTLTLRADTPVSGRVDLRQVKVPFLKDDQNFWPEGNTLLAGFTYESLSNFDSPDLDSRIKWLHFRDGYSAQTYQQLSSVYKAVGRDDFARDVLYDGQKRRPRPHLREKFWSWLLRLTVGYGYHPARVLYALLFLEVFGCVYFSIRRDDLKPSSSLLSAYSNDEGEAKEHLQPALYTLDLLLPVVTFGQRALWIAQGPTSWVVAILMAVGWVLGGILVYGIGTAYQRRSAS